MGKSKSKEPARTALSEDDSAEIDIDEGGPKGVKMQLLRGRVTDTMYKDAHHAATDEGCSVTDLLTEGLRYVLYGVQPRHVGIRKKGAPQLRSA